MIFNDDDDQRDQIGRFLKVCKVANYLTKVAQMYDDYFGYFESITFEVKTTVTTFWQVLEILGYILLQHLVILIRRPLSVHSISAQIRLMRNSCYGHSLTFKLKGLVRAFKAFSPYKRIDPVTLPRYKVQKRPYTRR